MEHITWSVTVGLVCLTLLSTSVGVLAKPRTPLPPMPERTLCYQRFDKLTTNNHDRIQVQELQTDRLFLQNVDLVESWSGHALEMGGNRAAYCFVPAVSPPRKNFAIS